MTYLFYLCFQKSKVTKYIWKPQHFCTSSKLGPGFPTPYVVVCLRSVVWSERWLFDMLILVALLTRPSLFSTKFKMHTWHRNKIIILPYVFLFLWVEVRIHVFSYFVLVFRFYVFQEVMYQNCCFFHYVSFAILKNQVVSIVAIPICNHALF